MILAKLVAADHAIILPHCEAVKNSRVSGYVRRQTLSTLAIPSQFTAGLGVMHFVLWAGPCC